VRLALERVLSAERVVVTKYAPPSDPARNELHVEVLRLHTLVGGTIVGHQYNP